MIRWSDHKSSASLPPSSPLLRPSVTHLSLSLSLCLSHSFSLFPSQQYSASLLPSRSPSLLSSTSPSPSVLTRAASSFLVNNPAHLFFTFPPHFFSLFSTFVFVTGAAAGFVLLGALLLNGLRRLRPYARYEAFRQRYAMLYGRYEAISPLRDAKTTYYYLKMLLVF